VVGGEELLFDYAMVGISEVPELDPGVINLSVNTMRPTARLYVMFLTGQMRRPFFD
jgi:hypothetical protein